MLILDPATGEKRVVPMRYHCRLPDWSAADERGKPGTYMAGRDSLSTVWRKRWGYNHAVVVTSRFFEAVKLHDLQHRSLVPGEREVSVELEFRPEPAQDMFLACFWRCSEATENETGFYFLAMRRVKGDQSKAPQLTLLDDKAEPPAFRRLP